MAEHVPFTPPVRADAAFNSKLPQIIDLGFALAAAEIEGRRLRASGARRRSSDSAAIGVTTGRAEALRALITTLPADTVADAAVQIGVACNLATTLARSDWTAPAERERISEMHEALYRITVSVLPVLAAAAGLDLAEMGWEDVDVLRADVFYGEERSG